MDVITSHINADFDSLACAVAARKIYPGAVIVFPGSLEKKVRDFIEVFKLDGISRFKDIDVDQISRLIIVDTKHPDRIGMFKALLSKKGVAIHIYDHHPPTRDDIKGSLNVLDTVGAASTLFAEIIREKKYPITPMEATLLCLGIYEETGSLIYSSTTPRDLAAASFLLKRGANLNIVADFLKEEFSKETVALLNELVQSLKEVVIHGIRIRIGKGTMESFGDVSYLAHKIMDMEDLDMDALIILISMADKILIVARSKVTELNVSHLLAEFGGGGHSTAASATIKDVPFEIVEEKIMDSLRKNIRPIKLAVDVMTTPVVVIPGESKVKDAEDMMTRYGVNVLPVLKGGEYKGIITREVVEKALFHGFGKSKCLDFATTDATTVMPETLLSEIEKTMIEQNQRFVAVMDGEKIVGAITRTDILRALYEDVLRKSRLMPEQTMRGGSYQAFGRNVSSLLKDTLPAGLYDFIVLAGNVADELGYGAYLVGGCVRDILRREENLDIDIVIEGDGISFARNLGERIAAKVTVHQAFGTAMVIKDMFKLDVATARTEYYEAPAALPKVETSSLKRDLYRRDFTINTLAVRINHKDFGHLIDFFGGQRDLKDKVIRVLHNLSFVEDPTRAFRAIRFSERFGFKITKHTENLIKLAVRMNIFDKLSGTRLYDELTLIFSETDPIKSLKRLADYDLTQLIHPKLKFSSELEAIMESVHDVISWFDLLFLNEKHDKELLYILALLHGLSRDERGAALERLVVPDKTRDFIIRVFNAAQKIARNLIPGNPVMIYHLLIDCEIEALLFSMASLQDNEKKKAISQYLLELRTIKPLINGEDLKSLGVQPGPLYSKIFGEVLNEKLVKKLPTKQDEIEFVRKNISRWVNQNAKH
ncbi:MAG TPA: CBS domain-containing protein [Dissulfurispiraceae bacterium]|nr:CBS domain-containing protein [Dissulfurispiraceae bacterium]